MYRDTITAGVHIREYKGELRREPPVTDLKSVLEGELMACKEFVIPNGPEERLVSINDPDSVGAELLRTLASRLMQAQKRHSIKKLLITSAVPGEGKTMVSANLAITLGLHRQRVAIIDGDLRSSRLSRWFGVVDESSAEKWCTAGADLKPFFRKAKDLPLCVLPAGPQVEMPGRILQSSEFAKAIEGIASEFEWIIFDSPPLIPFSDAQILATLADAVVLVTRRGNTPKLSLARALESVDKSKIIATIFNGADAPSHKYYYEYYHRSRDSSS